MACIKYCEEGEVSHCLNTFWFLGSSLVHNLLLVLEDGGGVRQGMGAKVGVGDLLGDATDNGGPDNSGSDGHRGRGGSHNRGLHSGSNSLHDGAGNSRGGLDNSLDNGSSLNNGLDNGSGNRGHGRGSSNLVDKGSGVVEVGKAGGTSGVLEGVQGNVVVEGRGGKGKAVGVVAVGEGVDSGESRGEELGVRLGLTALAGKSGVDVRPDDAASSGGAVLGAEEGISGDDTTDLSDGSKGRGSNSGAPAEDRDGSGNKRGRGSLCK